jgi:hypothetical protein
MEGYKERIDRIKLDKMDMWYRYNNRWIKIQNGNRNKDYFSYNQILLKLIDL